MSHQTPFHLSEEIRDALLNGRPVLALESTVITHGLPWPDNLEAARQFEDIARQEGAIPATIAILDRTIRIGLEAAELETLSRTEGAKKLNLSNLAAGVASGQPGSTTVVATMFIAEKVGIPVFSTGGIGGVHRGAEETFDISADLTALSRFQVAVVSAGAKAILDLPRTVEVLETLGVPVYGWQTDEFPAFYRRESGLPVDARFEKIEDLAKAVSLHWSLGFHSGVLVGNPCPKECELDRALHDEALARSFAILSREQVRGRDITPRLLEAMRETTAGQSVFTNRALLESNVRIGARLASALQSRHAHAQ